MQKVQMTEEEFEQLTRDNQDNDELQKYRQDYHGEDDGEEEVEETVHSDWKRSVFMGLVAGALWMVSIISGIVGIAVIIQGAVTQQSGWQFVGGGALVMVGGTVGVAAKLFYEKVKYGEV